jgi:hypothetical protein
MACERVAVAAAAAGQIETFAGVPGVETVAVDDASALATGIKALIARRDEWATMGERNRAHVLEHHSMRRWARDMADVYAELAPAHIAQRSLARTHEHPETADARVAREGAA